MILLTGAAGFIGSAVHTKLGGEQVRVLAHRQGVAEQPGTEIVTADLADPASLAGVCDGVDTVLHLASAISDDEQVCLSVNEQGTQALAAQAVRAGVRRIVYLSTAAVYGRGPFGGIVEDEVSPAPVSHTSRSRLRAEGAVLAAGGTVLRPMFVYGPGDQYLLPALVRTLCRKPMTVAGGRARLSMICVDDLAQVIATLARADQVPSRVYHVNHPTPVRFAHLYGALVAHLGVPTPTHDLSLAEVAAIARDNPALAHHLDLIGTDHWFAGDDIWRLTGLTPTPFDLTAAAQWYRRHLTLEHP
jgi:nucleoside-diphosphate-sugar epimerase